MVEFSFKIVDAGTKSNDFHFDTVLSSYSLEIDFTLHNNTLMIASLEID